MEVFLVKELRVRGSSLNKLTLSINQSLMRIRYNISKVEGTRCNRQEHAVKTRRSSSSTHTLSRN